LFHLFLPLVQIKHLNQFYFYLATNLPRLNCLADLYFLPYQQKLKFVQSCLDCMIWTTFGVLFFFLFFLFFLYTLFSIIFFSPSFLWNQLNIGISKQFEIFRLWNTQSPWDPINYRTLTMAPAGDGTSHLEVSRTPNQ